MEAATRIERVNRSFADFCLTTWLRRRVLRKVLTRKMDSFESIF